MKFKNYCIGKIVEVEKIANKDLKKCKVQIAEDEEEVQIVTNAKHVDEGDIVAVAKEGAIVPAGAEPESAGGDGVEVKKTAVGGHQSAGMLCDGVMLGWPNGSAGVLAKFNEFTDQFEIGGAPALIKPRK